MLDWSLEVISLMNPKFSEQMALLKFSVIAPVVNQTYGDGPKSAYFRKMATESFLLPDGSLVQFSPSTIKSWFQDYTRDGLDALRRNPRRDRGQSRILTDLHKDQIDQYRRDFPLISATMIYQRLIRDGHLLRQEVSLSTVQRYVQNFPRGRGQRQEGQQQRLAFEMEFANDCWQADYPELSVIPSFT